MAHVKLRLVVFVRVEEALCRDEDNLFITVHIDELEFELRQVTLNLVAGIVKVAPVGLRARDRILGIGSLDLFDECVEIILRHRDVWITRLNDRMSRFGEVLEEVRMKAA